ncbi:MAG: NAD(P)H-hydrate dehydratase [Clostridia bacterium]|nr:NAD(P)H-hydrate dehydratase [Clostridia bacterium]
MRKIDAEQAKLQTNGERTLMYNAGLCAVQAIEGSVRGGSAVILCGAGNNGGDGYVIAEELCLQGREVYVFNYQPQKRRKNAARYYMHRARSAGCRFRPLADDKHLRQRLKECSVVVDAVFGTGFHGALPEELCSIFELVAESSAYKVAIDCPSGIDPLKGTVENCAFVADMTVCMSYPMRGIYLLPARAYVGKVEVCDIGMDYRAIDAAYDFTDTVCDRDTVRRVFKKRNMFGHKGSFGKVLLICGSEAMPGAAVLALSGALRMGPGLCELCAPDKVIAAASAKFPEALYTRVPDTSQWSDDDVSKLVSRAEGCAAVLCGCGLGNSEGTKKLVQALCSLKDVRVVFDADGINALGECEWRGDGNILLTPHPKEFSRLTKRGVDEINSDRYELAKEFAADKNAVVLLKGADTVVADPSGRVCLNPTGNAGLAKGGSGDVLAGMCVGILGWSSSLLDAASCAAYLHGAAGDLLKSRYSEYGYLTGELAETAARVLGDTLKDEK